MAISPSIKISILVIDISADVVALLGEAITRHKWHRVVAECVELRQRGIYIYIITGSFNIADFILILSYDHSRRNVYPFAHVSNDNMLRLIFKVKCWLWTQISHWKSLIIKRSYLFQLYLYLFLAKETYQFVSCLTLINNDGMATLAVVIANR